MKQYIVFKYDQYFNPIAAGEIVGRFDSFDEAHRVASTGYGTYCYVVDGDTLATLWSVSSPGKDRHLSEVRSEHGDTQNFFVGPVAASI